MTERSSSSLTVLACAVLMVATASVAGAQTVVFEEAAVDDVQPVQDVFSDINDAAPGVCYDAATTTTATNPADPNQHQLVIGVHSGISPTTWTNTGCIASTASFYSREVYDTIAARVTAPDGYYISRITFSQTAVKVAGRIGQVFGGAQWVVDGVARPASLTGAFYDLPGCKTEATVSFSVSLGAKVSSTLAGNATASVANPVLTVDLKAMADCPSSQSAF